ncbi:MAG: nuclear transport factor 2 family protein [Ferruginibacter sp.]|nr:nuclear transport factor 2 family protein [Ferruginibacter sp.]
MRKIIVLMGVVFFSIHTYGQVNEKLIKAAVSLRALMVDPVKQQLENLLADSLSYGHSSGHIDSKKEFIEKLTSGKSDFVSIDITNQTVQVNKNTGIVRHDLSGVTNDSGKSSTVKLHVLTVWIKKGNRWMLAARQAVKIV